MSEFLQTLETKTFDEVCHYLRTKNYSVSLSFKIYSDVKADNEFKVIIQSTVNDKLFFYGSGITSHSAIMDCIRKAILYIELELHS